MSERVWLRNPQTGGVQHFAKDAADTWRRRGWVDAEPPPEPNIWRDEPPADGSETTKTSPGRADGIAEPAVRKPDTPKASTRRSAATDESKE